MKRIVLFFMILILLSGCGKEISKTDAYIFKEEYETLNNRETNYGDTYYRALEIDEENPIIYKKASDILKMIDNKETFVVYFGFASCPWCRSVLGSLFDVSSDLGIDKIYYVDVKEIRDVMDFDDNGNIITTKEGTADYYQLLNKLDNVLADYTLTDSEGNEIVAGEKRIYAPNIISVVDGVANGMTTGISDDQTDAYMELTDNMKNDSYEKIKCTIECVTLKKAICMADKKC